MKKVKHLHVGSPTDCLLSLCRDVDGRISWAEEQEKEIKEFLEALEEYLKTLRKVKQILDEDSRDC